jgi:hypothetical protein
LERRDGNPSPSPRACGERARFNVCCLDGNRTQHTEIFR